MSIAILVEVYDEMRRLAIAGSAVAAGDFHLKKLIPPLQKAGEKAPVFAKVAQAVQAVVDSTEKTASGALLELTTLVNAILYTQGETGIAGEFQPLETTDLGGQATQASARVLKPLLEALQSTGSGRMELIRDAHERGIFKDLRLVKPALQALDDPYSEIGELMAEQVLPLYGKAILPELRARLKIKERTSGHLHRLRLMQRLDPQGSRAVIQGALTDGSKEMKVVAIECLGTTADDLAYLLEQTRAKAKDVRAAALRALVAAGINRSDVVAALKKAVDGEDLELIVGRVQQTTIPALQNYVLEQAEKQFADTLKCKDAKLQGPAITRMQQLVSCLAGRTDAPAEAFLLQCFENAKALAAIKAEPSGTDLNELVAQLLAQGTPKMRQQLVATHGTLSGGMLSWAIYAARAIMSPADFFREFSPLLKLTESRGKKGDRGAALREILTADDEGRYFHVMSASYVSVCSWRGAARQDSGAAKLPELDERWLDAAIEAQAVELACSLARPGHPGVQAFLSAQFANRKKADEAQEVLQTMVRIGHPGAADALIEAVKKQAKATSYYYLSYWYGRMIAELPRSAYPKFEALLPTLPEKMVDQLMDSVLALKNKPE